MQTKIDVLVRADPHPCPLPLKKGEGDASLDISERVSLPIPGTLSRPLGGRGQGWGSARAGVG